MTVHNFKPSDIKFKDGTILSWDDTTFVDVAKKALGEKKWADAIKTPWHHRPAMFAKNDMFAGKKGFPVAAAVIQVQRKTDMYKDKRNGKINIVCNDMRGEWKMHNMMHLDPSMMRRRKSKTTDKSTEEGSDDESSDDEEHPKEFEGKPINQLTKLSEIKKALEFRKEFYEERLNRLNKKARDAYDDLCDLYFDGVKTYQTTRRELKRKFEATQEHLSDLVEDNEWEMPDIEFNPPSDSESEEEEESSDDESEEEEEEDAEKATEDATEKTPAESRDY